MQDEPSKAERLAEFLRRLALASPAITATEALDLIRKTLEQVEDELTTIPNNGNHPVISRTDARLYPPLDDMARAHGPRVTRYRNRGHNTYIGDNGSIEIKTLPGATIFEKPGADGRRVSEL